MTVIYLIRHGEIEQHDSSRRYIGQTDLPLTEKGREQVRQLADYLNRVPIDRYYSSPLSRCRESCTILKGNRTENKIELIPQLQEISLGEWEGLSMDEVRDRFPVTYQERGRNLCSFRPPGGECFIDLQQRAWSAFERLAGSGADRIMVVAHAGVNRVLLCTLLGMPLENLFRLGQDCGCLNRIAFRDGKYRLETMNFTP